VLTASSRISQIDIALSLAANTGNRNPVAFPDNQLAVTTSVSRWGYRVGFIIKVNSAGHRNLNE